MTESPCIRIWAGEDAPPEYQNLSETHQTLSEAWVVEIPSAIADRWETPFDELLKNSAIYERNQIHFERWGFPAYMNSRMQLLLFLRSNTWTLLNTNFTEFEKERWGDRYS